MTTPRRLWPIPEDTVVEPAPEEATGAIPSVDNASESASAAGVVVVRPAAVGLRVAAAEADDFAGWLTAPVVRRVSVCGRVRARGPALDELDLVAPADGPASEPPASA
ncbi:hypothetical protein [Mycolicibacterium helvum]|uniref:hypothetical protein n=1 Tax=Mycolicibacterium helvum TaxID=1534349 RepID=UPI0013D3DC30|nr:hypothetical protein [Mycolicibacterium helvum]